VIRLYRAVSPAVKTEEFAMAVHQVQLRWLNPEQGGRSKPFGGDRYVPTARFVGEQSQFSVVLEFPNNRAANPTNGTIQLLNPGLIAIDERLHPGVAIEIMEGPRIVAQCVVENLDVAADGVVVDGIGGSAGT